jgi:predicted RNA-binding Zn ribbon-like protein
MVKVKAQDSLGQVWRAHDFVGGHPALDFVNTVADTGKTREEDKIGSWPAVRDWAKRSGILSSAELMGFLAKGSLDGTAELAKLHQLREAAYAGLVSLLEGKTKDLQNLAEPIRQAMDRGRLQFDGHFFRWRPDPRTRHRWVDAAALSLEQLLRSDDIARLRQCARCTWLFIDRGRGVGRRWCVMRTCGNRAKAEMFRSR